MADTPADTLKGHIDAARAKENRAYAEYQQHKAAREALQDALDSVEREIAKAAKSQIEPPQDRGNE